MDHFNHNISVRNGLGILTLGKSSNRSPRTFNILAKVSNLLKQNLLQSLVKCIRNDYQNMQLINAFTELLSRQKER